ncbi:oxaloacetate decarboxylase gamma subunit [Vreelandella songnenensis]|uniref:Probable oxaloacetate decarboxylase gamma chain n=1 Tax=Vreelandella songnenensis TaxID=1176243 RepID=W0LVY6_9GAMM|nr:OadG family protein [Halomonas songnenensis]AHG28706.1 OadG [Halomonas songnenensis]PRY65150.1 oxaloacetate decarboxylase gamma subunit [Halomonas songnenensis]
MQDSELLQEGLAIMGLGMGFVFVFLTVLVISVTLMSKLIGRFQPLPTPAAPGSQGGRAPARADTDAEVQAVISAAVHRYRSSRLN